MLKVKQNFSGWLMVFIRKTLSSERAIWPDVDGLSVSPLLLQLQMAGVHRCRYRDGWAELFSWLWGMLECHVVRVVFKPDNIIQNFTWANTPQQLQRGPGCGALWNHSSYGEGPMVSCLSKADFLPQPPAHPRALCPPPPSPGHPKLETWQRAERRAVWLEGRGRPRSWEARLEGVRWAQS